MVSAALRKSLGLLLLCWPVLNAFAQGGELTAAVDRDQIHANESFTYVVRAEGRFAGVPDLSALTRDFDILQSGSTTTYQIVNGRATQVAEWTVELMPRSPGEFVLPPAELDGVLSNPVAIEILPPDTRTDAAADVFMEVELDRDEVYVQSQAVYTLRLFVGIATGREALVPPSIEGGEAIVESLGQDGEYQTVRGGRNYRVRERRFAIFPQTAGTLTIGPAEYQATVIPNLGFSRRQSLISDSIDLAVLPAVAPPDQYPDAVWLPARNLTIEESWGDVGTSFEQGVPRTRQLTIEAEGLLETQLPEVVLSDTGSLRQYADQPDLERDIDERGITARRTERYAVIASQPGQVELPAVELPWWNVDQGRWEVARIDPVSLEVLPGAGIAEPDEPELAAGQPVVIANDPGFWPWLSAGLGAGWLLTVLAWFAKARLGATRGAVETSREPRRVSALALNRQISAACRVNDAPRTRELLLEWAARQFGDDAPTSLGALSARLSGPLGERIAELEAALYGREEASWDGRELAELMKSTRSVALKSGGNDEDPLVPLYR